MLKVGVALPDPPFNGMGGAGLAGGGLDIDLIAAIAAALDASPHLIAYRGADFNGIFDGLADGSYDCVIAGTTVTPERRLKAAFAPPYLISGQSLAVNTARHPGVTSVDELAGLTIGVQQGNTSQPVARRLVAEGKAKAVRTYPYGGIEAAMGDLGTGAVDAFMKLAPVLTELVRPVPDVDVVQRGLTREEIAIAVRLDDQVLLGRITDAQAGVEQAGTLQELRRKWLGNPYLDQGLAAL